MAEEKTTPTQPAPGRNPVRALNYLLLLASLIALLGLGQQYGTRYYVAWDDESLFTDIARTYAQSGILGTPTHADNGLKMAEKTYFMPPLYPLALGYWFKLCDPNLANARLFSNLVAALGVLALFGVGTTLRPDSFLPGLCCLLLAIDVEFASMYNWARPDILTLSLVCAALFLYIRALNRPADAFPTAFAWSWLAACTAMLTHPIGGLLGFCTIPLHLVISRTTILRSRHFWAVFLGVPLAALLLWSLYIAQDFTTFKHQFFEWQMGRKAARFTDMFSYLALFEKGLINFGVKGAHLFSGVISTLLLGLAVLGALNEKDPRRPLLLVALLMLLATLAVEWGGEIAYLPLRLPAFYLAFALCIAPYRAMGRKVGEFRLEHGTLKLNYSLLLGLLLGAISISSAQSTWELIDEINYSRRARAYNPQTLANHILARIEKGKSIGVRTYPDCLELLEQSGKFTLVKKLAWHRLSPQDLQNYVLANDYLAITESFLEPRHPGRLNFLRTPGGGLTAYRQVAQTHYQLHAKIQLPSGGTTLLYKRAPAAFAQTLAE